MAFDKAKAHLEKFGLGDRVKEFPVSSATVELAAQAVGCEPAHIAKTLSFMVDGHPVLTEVETDALDGLWWGEDRYYQFAVARLGRQVLFVRYRGAADLRGEAAYLASLLT